MVTYKDPYTLDGLVPFGVGVNQHKLSRLDNLLESALRGNRADRGLLETAITTSDAIFSLAHRLTVSVISGDTPADQLQPFDGVVGERRVSDFRPTALFQLSAAFDGDTGVTGGGGNHIPVAPVVPEGAPYPRAVFSGDDSVTGKATKSGLITGFTMEALKNDILGVLSDAPNQLRALGNNTIAFNIHKALVDNVTGKNLTAGTGLETGASVVANSPLTRDALALAIKQLRTRRRSGRYVYTGGKITLLVPNELAEVAEFIVKTSTLESIDENTAAGSRKRKFAVQQTYSPFGAVTVKVDPFLTPDGSGNLPWYVFPSAEGRGTARPVLDQIKMIGEELPEVRVSNITGVYQGGGAVSPFEGSFDTDNVDFRLRVITGGVLWTPEAVVWSNGSGS